MISTLDNIEAESKIEKLLKELEIKTNGYIRGIEIQKMDVTSVSDKNTKYIKNVKIHLESRQNYKWSSE